MNKFSLNGSLSDNGIVASWSTRAMWWGMKAEGELQSQNGSLSGKFRFTASRLPFIRNPAHGYQFLAFVAYFLFILNERGGGEECGMTKVEII